ncbi:hypothetical protein ACFL6S_14030 [Candidatus Poribacteria bacterium]
MFSKRLIVIVPAIILVSVFTFSGQSAYGYNATDGYYGERSRQDRHFPRDDKMISVKRHGREVDDWVERGESSVTESPEFKDGIRLAARANRRSDDDYALASAIYFFDIPRTARSIEIKVEYEGKSGRGDYDDNLVGSVWIKSAGTADGRGSGSSREERFRDDDQPPHGDTFVLREGKRNEKMEISARDHALDGTMELHVIVEGRQTLDVKRIEVKTSKRSSDVRVVTREYGERTPERWNNRTYSSFYTGPVHRSGDRHYVRYVYPQRRHVEVRKVHRNRIYRHSVRRPHFRLHWSSRSRYTRQTYGRRHPARLRKWTPFHAEIRW